jgi:hypothetical protein
MGIAPAGTASTVPNIARIFDPLTVSASGQHPFSGLFLQRQHAGFGLSCASCTRYAIALESPKRYLFLCKDTLAAKYES